MAASEEMEFEKAIEYRELLNSVKQIAQKQKITHIRTARTRILLRLRADDRDAVVQVFFIRGWKTDRTGSLLCTRSEMKILRNKYLATFCKTVLFRHAVYSARDHAAGGDR